MPEKVAFSGSRFVAGQWENGFGLKFDVAEDGVVSATFAFSDNKQGLLGLVHGGALSAVIDEAVTVASFVNQRPRLTVNLNIDFKAPVPLNTQVTAMGRVEKIEGRKTFLSAQIQLDNGKVAVSAQALFIYVAEFDNQETSSDTIDS
jgi:uncharacterized protein (TIGR00369 family)